MSNQITRPQLAARIAVLRSVLDVLWTQVELDGHEPFTAIGPLKVELIRLEQQLRVFDGRTPRLPLPVALALAGRGTP